MGSRPPTLTTRVRRCLVDECEVARGDGVLVAVSGGSDSMALMHALSLLRAKFRLDVAVGCIDHGLRESARQDVELVASTARELGLVFRSLSVEVSRGGNLQARARRARYDALRRLQNEIGMRYLCTAHHSLDRAETVLMRIFRGAPPNGLAVLPPRSGDLLRPMIRASKADVMAHLARHQIDFREDPSNRDARFLRVRIRHEVMPLLWELAPGIVGHLNSLADELAEDALPVPLAQDGFPIRLGQAQRRELRQALRHRSTRARVLLKGAKTLGLDPDRNLPQIFPDAARHGGRVPKIPKKPKKG